MLADIPSEGSGLGSSSALTVGLLNAFYSHKGIQVSRERLAEEACEIEIEILNKPIGKQDQYSTAYGGVNEFNFYDDGTVKVHAIKFPDNKLRILGSNLLLFYTNTTRKSDEILTKQKEKIKIIYKTLLKMRDQVGKLRNFLETGENEKLGVLINEGWSFKKSLLEGISNRKIENMYSAALSAGTTGGKICGAGGGGFMLLYVPREKQNAVRNALLEYKELPFMLDKHGSRIVFNQAANYWR